ncbi:hypothetical protein R80B4_00008 [Fibrobacteres bacterium R8-0-B4]
MNKAVMAVRALTAVVAAACLAAGCAKKPGREAAAGTVNTLPIVYGTLTDQRDGREYKTVKIGKQVWMAQNLNYPADGSRCEAEVESECGAYGRMYDWKTALAVCPNGWHLPTRAEWGELTMLAGDQEIRGFNGTAGKKLKSTSGWGDKERFNGTDAYGFSAIPCARGDYAKWWTATEYSISGQVYKRGLDVFDEYTVESNGDMRGFEPVRCVQDAENQGVQPPSEIRGGRLVDGRDDKRYTIVTIGNKMWMAENLNYRPPRDSSWCYGDDDRNCEEYGRLYDWNAAMKACPAGWHLPTRAEWKNLAVAAGGGGAVEGAKSRAGAALKAKWHSIYEYDGTDDYGFTALPGGIHHPRGFALKGEGGYWWIAERSVGDSACYFALIKGVDDAAWGEDYAAYGMSVRCVNDFDIPAPPPTPPAPPPSAVVGGQLVDGRDGKKYKAAKINGKTWMAQNLDYQPPSGMALCYNDDTSVCKKYGRLYDWRTAMKACPVGWHLPTRKEWGELAVFAGGTGAYGEEGVAGKKLKSKKGWSVGRAGTDNYGFSALPGGRSTDGYFFYSGADGIPLGGMLGLPGIFGLSDSYGVWWTADEYGCCNKAYYRLIGSGSDMPEYDDEVSDGLSVRCVADDG